MKGFGTVDDNYSFFSAGKFFSLSFKSINKFAYTGNKSAVNAFFKVFFFISPETGLMEGDNFFPGVKAFYKVNSLSKMEIHGG